MAQVLRQQLNLFVEGVLNGLRSRVVARPGRIGELTLHRDLVLLVFLAFAFFLMTAMTFSLG